MRRFAIVTLTLALSAPFAAPPATAEERLNDSQKQRALEIVRQYVGEKDGDELRHAIDGNFIADEAGFRKALQQTCTRVVDRDLLLNQYGAGQSSGLSAELAAHAEKISQLDTDGFKDVPSNPASKGNFFGDLASIPASYQRTIDLAGQFNPAANTDESPRLSAAIDTYLASIASNPCIQYALAQTGTTLADLKKVWFGSGRGFEHIFAGELKGRGVSGYHFWFKYYSDERAGKTRILKTFPPIDGHAYCGSFTWDPDGAGNQYQIATKPKGGFLIGESAPALLAMGHLAMMTAKKYGNPSSFVFSGNLNGKSYKFQVFAMNGVLRSLYPMDGGKDTEETKAVAHETLIQELVEPVTLH